MKKIISVSALAITLFISCSKGGNGGGSNGGGAGGGGTIFTVDCSTVSNKAFTANVAPIIANSCAIANCHATGSSNGPGALTTYTQIAGNSSAIRTAVANGSMPQTGTLTAAQKSTIICWVDSGSPQN